MPKAGSRFFLLQKLQKKECLMVLLRRKKMQRRIQDEKRILASVLVLVMLICLLPVTAIADGNEGWKVDGQTVRIYTAKGLRAWADSITNEHTSYDGFKVSIEKI